MTLLHFPADLQPGDYELRLVVYDFLTQTPTVQQGMSGRRRSPWRACDWHNEERDDTPECARANGPDSGNRAFGVRSDFVNLQVRLWRKTPKSARIR